jgi:hypothetical protein
LIRAQAAGRLLQHRWRFYIGELFFSYARFFTHSGPHRSVLASLTASDSSARQLLAAPIQSRLALDHSITHSSTGRTDYPLTTFMSHTTPPI